MSSTTNFALKVKIQSVLNLEKSQFLLIWGENRDYFLVGERVRFLFTSELLQVNE